MQTHEGLYSDSSPGSRLSPAQRHRSESPRPETAAGSRGAVSPRREGPRKQPMGRAVAGPGGGGHFFLRSPPDIHAAATSLAKT